MTAATNSGTSARGALQLLALVAVVAFVLSGCIIVKGSEEEERARASVQAPRPVLPMSDDLIRSESGDMIAFLPSSWFLMDVQDKVSSSVFAVAVNSDYTASLVFSELRLDDALEDAFQKEGLIGVARASYQKRERKTAGLVKNTGGFDVRAMGTKQFGIYEYSDTGMGGVLPTRVAVFRSALGNFYECTLAILPFTGRKVPTKEEIENIYQSVLATIDY